MGQKSKIVAVIPVRGGSKSIPYKNIKLIAGKPLLFWVCDAAYNCNFIDEVYISTDDSQILSVAQNLILEYWSSGKVKTVDRDPNTATDHASTEAAMVDFSSKVRSDILVLIQATSPLLTSDQLESGIKKMIELDADSVISVVNQKRFVWGKDGKWAVPKNYNPAARPRRQDWDGMYIENGAFYATKTELFNKSGVRLNGNIVLQEMPEESYIELDEPLDWELTEKILDKRIAQGNYNSKTVKLVVTDNDGVLTDGGMYYDNSGEVIKKFNSQDGMGFQLLRENGIEVAIISGEDSTILKRRAEKLKVTNIFLGVKNKKEILLKLLKDLNIDPSETVYIGDDINDFDAMKICGKRITVSNGNREIKKIAHYITERHGGDGAFREAVDWVLKYEK